MRPAVVCVVEGHGEVQALPVLIRRIAAERGIHGLVIPKPIRCPKSKLLRKRKGVQTEELVRRLRLATAKLSNWEGGAVLILVDADEDCPAEIGPALSMAARTICGNIPCAVVLAKREYEAWFLAAIESLRRAGKLVGHAEAPGEPESVSDPKRCLSRLMPPGRSYRETVDQPAFSALMDLSEAQKCPSFAKLRRDVASLLDRLTGPGVQPNSPGSQEPTP